MYDRYRIYIALFVAPVAGLLTFLFLWFQPSVLCSVDAECFRKLPVTVVLFMTYLLYTGLFLTGISSKARELYSESGLPFWRLAKASAHGPLLLALAVTALMLITELPDTISGWIAVIFSVALPVFATFVLYTSWYLIVGRHNRQIKFDAQKERTLVA